MSVVIISRAAADGQELPAALAELPPAGREARQLHRRRADAHPRPPLPLRQPVIILGTQNYYYYYYYYYYRSASDLVSVLRHSVPAGNDHRRTYTSNTQVFRLDLDSHGA
jgi:hypothetical protein